MPILHDLSDEQLATLPIDKLGMATLNHFAATQAWNTHNLLNGLRAEGRSEQVQRHVAEALGWLFARGLLARDTPGQTSAQSAFITRAGQFALERGPEFSNATERLNLQLHDRLEQARTQFLLGEFELAAFAAMREVEIRVRELSGADASLLGVKLMRSAFKPDGGTLANEDLEPGEQVGTMELFAGAIGTFKNPPSHRQVDYTDPTEASEVVMLADLLMRLLDRIPTKSH